MSPTLVFTPTHRGYPHVRLRFSEGPYRQTRPSPTFVSGRGIPWKSTYTPDTRGNEEVRRLRNTTEERYDITTPFPWDVDPHTLLSDSHLRIKTRGFDFGS